MSTFHYPAVRRDETVVDVLHGTQVPDPYRWLEDPDSAETKAFVAAQNELFFSYIEKCPFRSDFRRTLTELWNYEKYGCPFKRGEDYYHFHNSGLQAQSVLYQRKGLDAPPRVFLDPNTLSKDGTVSLNTYGFSKSGRYLAYGLSSSGSDWVSVHVRETQEGAPAEAEARPLEWAKFTGLQWTHDDRGFFYNRYPKPAASTSIDKGTETDSNKNAALYYHVLGTSQDMDVLIYKPDHPDHMMGSEVSDDGRFVILTEHKGCDPEQKLYILDLDAQSSSKIAKGQLGAEPSIIKLVDDFTASWDYVANDGSIFWFQTTLKAPKKRIVKCDISKPHVTFSEVVPESEDLLSFNKVVNDDTLILVYLHDVKHVAKCFSLKQGKTSSPPELQLPVGSIITSLSGRREDREIFYSYSSFTTPGSIARFDFSTQRHSLYYETKVKGLQKDTLETKQVFYSSKDGTKIPMYIIARKGTLMDGNNITLLYGYGGFNVSITPSFSVTWVTFVQHMKGVVAVANIRGGGEYGQEKWYNQGRLAKKQNVFDDFQAAAKYLVANKYTQPTKLAINGGSNGGLLVAACLNQAPELVGCGIADVGVMDLYRFHKFTIGHAWTSDYGDPNKKEDFEVLRRYSPVHNVQARAYPAVLITTGDHDDRVVPLHSHKLLATLQHVAKASGRPIMERVETKAGHGAGKSTQQRIEEATDKFAFLALTLGATWNP